MTIRHMSWNVERFDRYSGPLCDDPGETCGYDYDDPEPDYPDLYEIDPTTTDEDDCEDLA